MKNLAIFDQTKFNVYYIGIYLKFNIIFKFFIKGSIHFYILIEILYLLNKIFIIFCYFYYKEEFKNYIFISTISIL